MIAREFNSMLNGLDLKIQQFNILTLIRKIKNKELTPEQITKLKTDVYNLEEDLMIIDCGHK